MGALIDSSVLIAAERGALDLDSILREHRDTEFALSSMTASELLHGVHRASTEARKVKREAFVELFVRAMPHRIAVSIAALVFVSTLFGQEQKTQRIGL